MGRLPAVTSHVPACCNVSCARLLRPQVWPLLLGAIGPEDNYRAQREKANALELEYLDLRRLAGQTKDAERHFTEAGAHEDWQATLRRIAADSGRTGGDSPHFRGPRRAAAVQRLERLLEVRCSSVLLHAVLSIRMP